MAASKPYRVHPLAWEDIDAADAWYFERSRDASDGFVVEVSLAIETICEAPQRWPKYLHGTRRFLLDRYPFSVIYLDQPDFVNVVAVAHHKRKPGYWKQRI
jgi:plasmid stabilization system protein ParE